MTDLIDEMIELDAQGFILPPGQEPDAFRQSAHQTLQWSHALREELELTGRAEIFGEAFTAAQLVPEQVIAECLEPARTAYKIDPAWVPAFFSSSHLPWYVGGATFYEGAGGPFEVLFLLREPFREKRRWLIYERSEIVSHEACHVAGAMMGRRQFEEPLAYAISRSGLRRAAGGVFRARWEAGSLVAGSTLLIAGSLLELAGLSAWIKLFCAVPLLGAVGALAQRGIRTNRALSAARRFLQPVFEHNTAAVLFRCSDAEILSLARAAAAGTSPWEWLECTRGSLRWQVIQRRLLPGQEQPEPPEGPDAPPPADQQLT